MFDDRSINVLAYNLETILAEKIETVLSRGIANTRPRDYYDIHTLYELRKDQCNFDVLLKALEKTMEKRGSQKILVDYKDIISGIRASNELNDFWNKYQNNFDYAKDISFDETCNTILNIMDSIIDH